VHAKEDGVLLGKLQRCQNTVVADPKVLDNLDSLADFVFIKFGGGFFRAKLYSEAFARRLGAETHQLLGVAGRPMCYTPRHLKYLSRAWKGFQRLFMGGQNERRERLERQQRRSIRRLSVISTRRFPGDAAAETCARHEILGSPVSYEGGEG